VREPLRYLARLTRFAFAQNPLLYLAVALSLASVAVELLAMTSLLPLSSLAVGQALPADSLVVRALQAGGVSASFATLALVFVILFALRTITQLASQGVYFYFGRRILAQLASRAFGNIVKRAGLRQIEKNSIGYFISLAGDESFRASTLVISLIQLVGVGALATLYFVAIAIYSANAAVAVVAFLAVSGVSLIGSLRRSQRLGERQIEQSRSAGSLFLDALNGLRAVRAFSAEDYVAVRYRSEMFDYVRTLFRIDFVNLLSRSVPVLVLLVAFGAALGGGWLHGRSEFDVALVVTLLVLLLRFFPVVGQALNVLMRIVADSKAAKDVTTVIAGSPPSGADAKSQSLDAPVGLIVVRDLDFTHTGERPVLKGFNTRFERGRSYALVGPSGSGKSTLLDLLLGFYPPDSGEILIDGVPIGSIREASLRRRLLLLGQQPTIFNDTVLNNLCFGTAAPMGRVETASRLALLQPVIEELPRGYDTVLSYQGSNLSGGQRQRIGLARALLREPDVLLLDESTSALDRATRDEVVTNILREYRNRIVVFATHDESVASRVDVVVEIGAAGSLRPQIATAER
jgi:ABC-type bacteriocin/lantibiotic exporter with double-glycine peptidase domain